MKKENRLQTVKNIFTTFLIIMALNFNKCLATGVGTAEVKTATENIKRVITSIAMPLGRYINFCKYSNCSY